MTNEVVEKPGLRGGARAIGEIIAAFAGLFVASGILGSLATPLAPAWLKTPLMAMAMWGAVLAGALLLALRRSSYGRLGLARPKSWGRTLAWALLALAVADIGAVVIGEAVRHWTDWPPLDLAYIRQPLEGDPVAWLTWLVLVVWGSAAIGEELFARGFVMDRLRALFGGGRAGIIAAVLVQAALFGLLHAIQGPTGVVVTAYAGIVLAAAYYGSGRNLWAPIIAHGLMDTIGLTMIFLGLPLPGHVQ